MGIFNKRRTYDDVIVLDNYEYYWDVKEERQGFHWGWWLFWGVCFWPAVILMTVLVLNYKVYLVEMEDINGRVDKWWVSQELHDKIVDMFDEDY